MSPETHPFRRFLVSELGIFLLTCVVGLFSIFISIYVLRDYGLTLFLGVPLAQGFALPFLLSAGRRYSFLSMILMTAANQFAIYVLALLCGIDGLVCLFMAMPLWMPVTIIAASLAHTAQEVAYQKKAQHGFPVIGLLILLSVPFFMGAEHMAPPQPPTRMITTAIEISASSDIVWQNVITFPDLQPPADWLFRLGVAYPKHARIEGHGVGAVRYCVFSTGEFVEPITTWEDNRLLAFNVTKSPPSMRELSPYDIHPVHLEHHLVSVKGQFRLVDLGHGRTRLEGTTWYYNRMAPATYWNLWSDNIIHAIHQQVLTHIKTLSEQAPLAH